MQTNMFEFMYDTYQIKKPIKLIEFFAGYGSQNLALKYLDSNYEHHRICEWATKSIQAYNDIHIQDYTDYSQFLTFDEVVNYLFKKGISMNYNEPMTLEQIKRKGEKWCRNVYNNIIATKNLVNIQQVKAKDLDITDTENLTYLLTYSFPCQDISGAGLGKGFAKGSGTRSGMLWEVERILNECYELNCLPQCLVMENVPLIHSKENYPHLLEWIKALEKLGYQSYWQDLNAVDYGVPQNRNRTFMVSILGDYNYTFPKKFGLELRLKDLLEETVDEKYYLSEKLLNCFMSDGTGKYPRKERFLQNINRENQDVANSITTLAGSRATDNFIIENSNKALQETLELNEVEEFSYIDAYNRSVKNDGIAGTITTRTIPSNNTFIDVPRVNIQGKYIKGGFSAGQVIDKNGIAPTFMEHHGHIMAVVEEPQYSDYSMKKIQGNIVTEDVCGTITANAMQSITHNNCHLVVEDTPKLIGGIGKKKSNGRTQYYQQDRVYDSESVTMRHCANIPNGSYNYQVKEKRKSCYNCKHFCYDTFCGFNNPMCSKYGSLYDKESVCDNCLDYEEAPKIEYQDLTNLRIRKLTPRECLKLMGLKNEDIVNISKNQSDSSLYHLAGDSIVTTCLMAIFGELLGIDWKSKISEVIKDLCYTNIN